jgi:cell division protein FtsN
MMNFKHKMTGNARPIPVWLWFFAAFAVSSFVGLLMYLDLYEKGKVSGNSVSNISHFFTGNPSDSVASKKQQHQATPKNGSTPEHKNTSFDFYSLLPKMEVLVPESELSHPGVKHTEKEKIKSNHDTKQATASIPEPTPISGIKGNYFLQAGAFKDFQAADRMKANLGLLGIESKIESVTLDSGRWHRVRIGPFADLQQMNKTRKIMKSNNISSIMVKVKS